MSQRYTEKDPPVTIFRINGVEAVMLDMITTIDFDGNYVQYCELSDGTRIEIITKEER